MLDSHQPRPTRVRYYVLAALCAITFVNYVQRNSFGGLETTIRTGLSLEKTDTGLAIAAFFWIYALMQIPTGKLAQRIGPRRALALYAGGWSLAAAALGLSTGVFDLVAYRGAMGALQAGIFPCATLIMMTWLPPTQRGTGSALLNSFMLLGGAAVSNFTGLLLAPFGWRMVMAIYAVPGILLAVWFYWWFRNRPDEHAAVNLGELDLIRSTPDSGARPVEAAAPTATVAPRAVLVAILLSAPLWVLCSQQFFRAGAMRFIDGWLSTYLQEVPLRDHVDDDLRPIASGSDDGWFTVARQELDRLKKLADRRKAIANHLTSLPLYAGIPGGMLGGMLSDWLLRRTSRRRIARNGVAAGSLLLAVLSFLPIFFLHEAHEQIIFFSLGCLLSSAASPCAYAMSMDIGKKDLPLVFGAMNMVGNFGAAAMSQVVPLVNRAAGGWQAVLVLYVAVHGLALILWLFLNPNRTIGERS